MLKELETLKRTLKVEIQKSNGLEADIEQQKSNRNSERVALDNKIANLKSIIKEKSIHINLQKEKFGKTRFSYERKMREIIQKMKDQLSNIRLKATNSIIS